MPSKNKDIAQDFLKLCANGASRVAFRRYVSENFIHHNAYFKGDRETLMIAMEDSYKQSPNKLFDIQRMIEEDDLVAVHSHLKSSDLDMVVMHILRFKDKKITELWDFGQQIPREMINENGMF